MHQKKPREATVLLMAFILVRDGVSLTFSAKNLICEFPYAGKQEPDKSKKKYKCEKWPKKKSSHPHQGRDPILVSESFLFEVLKDAPNENDNPANQTGTEVRRIV
ncbi:hypothetical protein [Ponticaulis sp.]|uniref:hypothetical protein n=1 Tax=Ponticaulis sp. TaxID=2020902 RepID=UPI0025F6851E|nr:hypothetical protein [Ponticaulis sp.]|tara:strand:- start:4237 stop:4551 length:315 start_codon:yes stop_codon:yes gene_type:complete